MPPMANLLSLIRTTSSMQINGSITSNAVCFTARLDSECGVSPGISLIMFCVGVSQYRWAKVSRELGLSPLMARGATSHGFYRRLPPGKYMAL